MFLGILGKILISFIIMFLRRLFKMLNYTYVAHITLDRAEIDYFPLTEYPSPAQQKSVEAWGLGQVLPGMAVQGVGSSRRKQCGCMVRGGSVDVPTHFIMSFGSLGY